MNRDFRSDNTLGCSPEIAEALERAGHGSLTAYGNDEITARVRDRCRTIFNRDVDVFPVLTGTAGNALAVAAMTPPWGAVFCHEDAHIQRDELGAVEFYSGGAKLMPIAGAGGKLHPEDLAREIDVVANSRRTAVPAVVSLTQATEAGTVYSRDEMRELCEVARSKNVRVHIDGARFANALVAGGGGAEDADILTFGATKNGALGAEVIVVFARELAADLALRVHRAGHRVSKMRILSAQLEAYLSDDLWLRNARHANAMAGRLRDGLARVAEIVRPVEANVIFVRLPEALATRLQEQGFLFFDWPIFGEDVYRLVCGFSTTGDDVDGFVKALGS